MLTPQNYEENGAYKNAGCTNVGLCNLRHVDDEIAVRGEAVARYRERLEGVSGLTLIASQPGVHANHAYLPVFFEDSFGASRDEVLLALERGGVLCRKYFYPLVSDYACYRGRFSGADTPVARDRAARVLTLPLYGALSRDDVDRVCDAVLDCGR